MRKGKNGAQTKCPETKRPEERNVWIKNVERHNAPRYNVRWIQHLEVQNVWRNTTSRGTKCPETNPRGTKCPDGQDVRRDKKRPETK
jgi:autonomous glycyl radical cofactor GrcA